MVTGHLAGMFNGRLIMDPILFPVLMVTVATVLKAVLSSLILSIFSIDYSGSIFISSSFGFELLINALLAPVLFLLLGILMDRIMQERKTL